MSAFSVLAPGPAAIASRDPSSIEDGPSDLMIGLSTAGMALGAYHGYVRNQSIGWAIGWAVLGAAFPLITVPVALAQGFGKRA